MSKALDNFKKLMEGAGQNDLEQFLMILSLPDEQFDSSYPAISAQMEKIYNSKEFREEVLSTLNSNPIVDFESEKAEIESIISDIETEETLSKNKKAFIIDILKNSMLKVYELYENPREKITVKVKKLNPDAIIPSYAHILDAGCDICAIEDVTIKPNETGVIVKTGLAMAIPSGYEFQVRPRSGLSHKTKMRIANAPGTIDSPYRGEVGVIIDNIGNLSINIEKGQKIAQLVLAVTPMAVFDVVDELDETERGTGGFGSTGV